MRVGFLGLQGAGKSTLFAAVAGRAPGRGTAPTATGVVRVPDARVERLSALFAPAKTTFAEIVFLDPAVERGADGPVLPEPMLAAVRDVDVLVLVVRAFEAPEVPRPRGSVSASADLQCLEEELVLRDLERVDTRLRRLTKEGKKPETAAERQLLEKVRTALESEIPLREGAWSEAEQVRLRGFQFLSLKPALVVWNVGEEDLQAPPPLPETRPGRQALVLSARIESELAALEAAERQEYLASLGLVEEARDAFVRRAFHLLDLICFFTVGEDEVRAWQVRRGAQAPEAAGKIHSDLQKGFIRAEVIHYDEFLRVGSLGAAREQGVLRLEGKQYVVQDGDIMHVRHS
ncbi:MAG TPA: DUF933 domain-containing protein [Candidatus Krumholzibacteria bacterium]|nr:DUF933 domain-containing protein [Candidatus Krumholzibacteria bacterium]